ncbi:hypothetical protein [Nonomuraea sp. NPDC005650]|uniref:hypothetical protein n=1 Tax=Nonomuraea sp. NPDC005650 TaxID=3157045 RepID=UPI0033A749FE
MSNPNDDATIHREHEPSPVGELLDKLGVTACIHDGDFVSDAVVVFKVLDSNGVIKLGMATSKDIQSYDVEAMLRMMSDHVRFGSKR